MHRNSLLSDDRLAVIQALCKRVENIEGSTAEFGVYQGGSAKVISDALPNKFLHLFDTFTGIPFRGNADIHEVGDFSDTFLNDVRNLIGHHNTWYHVGLFPAGFDSDEKFCLVHLDCDQYQSMKDGLEFFYPRMSVGGIIIIDDYGWQRCPGVKKSVDAFLSNKKEKLHSDATIQVYFQKE